MKPYITFMPSPRRNYRRAAMILAIWTASGLVSAALIAIGYTILR